MVKFCKNRVATFGGSTTHRRVIGCQNHTKLKSSIFLICDVRSLSRIFSDYNIINLENVHLILMFILYRYIRLSAMRTLGCLNIITEMKQMLLNGGERNYH